MTCPGSMECPTKMSYMMFLKEFEAMVGRIPPTGTGFTDEDVRKKVFHACLEDLAKNWLFN